MTETVFMFRSLPLRAMPVLSVDREQRIIYGVSAAQAVEALGHGMTLDGRTIAQVVEHGNAARNGVKSRFAHPGLSSDGMGKYLGRLRDFRQEGDKAIADLHLAASAFKTPDGDLGTYIMDMAEDDPDMFGMSMVVKGERFWTLADGTEIEAVDPEGNARKRPENATTQHPVLRVKQLMAVDAVDEPAANRDGLFAARHLWATNGLAQEAFADIDEYLGGAGVTPQKAFQFALAYFTARGVDVKEFATMQEQEEEKQEQEQQPEQPATEQPAASQDENAEPAADVGAELAALKAQIAAMQAELAAKGERESELSAALNQADERLAGMERTAMRARFAELAAGWYGETAKHVDMLEKLAALDGEAGDSFQFYLQTQAATAEQMRASALFGEKGTDKPGNFASAAEQVVAMATVRAKEQGITLSEALKQVFGEQPGLYEQYTAEASAKGRG